MKTIKALLVVVVLALGSQANAQKILDKWEDLNSVNQIVAKVNYVVNENRFDIITDYTSLLATYTAKLDAKSVEGIGIKSISETINNLKTKATALDNSAKQKASKEEIQNNLKSFNETLTEFINTINSKLE